MQPSIGGILAHRRDDDAVVEAQTADFERREKMGLRHVETSRWLRPSAGVRRSPTCGDGLWRLSTTCAFAAHAGCGGERADEARVCLIRARRQPRIAKAKRRWRGRLRRRLTAQARIRRFCHCDLCERSGPRAGACSKDHSSLSPRRAMRIPSPCLRGEGEGEGLAIGRLLAGAHPAPQRDLLPASGEKGRASSPRSEPHPSASPSSRPSTRSSLLTELAM